MSHRETMLVDRVEVEHILTLEEAIEAVEEAFRLYGEGRARMPAKVYIDFDKGDVRTMPAYLPDLGLASVKNVNSHPGNTGVPTVMATLTLFDPETGFPLAVMDATTITKYRTGAAGCIATQRLARADAHRFGFIGAGVQARTQFDCMALRLPELSEVLVFDTDRERAEAFAGHCWETGQVAGIVMDCADSVARDSGVLTTTTPSRSPVVRNESVRPGTHINAIGADAPGKQELEHETLKNARIVIDNWEQASHGGEINTALASGAMTRDDVYADLGEIVTGKKPGRDSDEQITVFDSTGLAIQDLACAAKIYNKIQEDPELKDRIRTVDFLSLNKGE